MGLVGQINSHEQCVWNFWSSVQRTGSAEPRATLWEQRPASIASLKGWERRVSAFQAERKITPRVPRALLWAVRFQSVGLKTRSSMRVAHGY